MRLSLQGFFTYLLVTQEEEPERVLRHCALIKYGFINKSYTGRRTRKGIETISVKSLIALFGVTQEDELGIGYEEGIICLPVFECGAMAILAGATDFASISCKGR